MKKLLFLFLFLPTISICQTMKWDFVPKSGVVGLVYDDLKIYSDSTSIFLVCRENNSNKQQRIKNEILINIIQQEFITIGKDSVLISLERLQIEPIFESSLNAKNYLLWVILKLVDKKKLRVYDSRETLISTVYAKKVGSRNEGLVRLVYFNKLTDEELFSKLIYRED